MSKSHLILGLGILVGAILATTSRKLRRRQDTHELKENVQRWEDEGGNVPEVRPVSPRPK